MLPSMLPSLLKDPMVMGDYAIWLVVCRALALSCTNGQLSTTILASFYGGDALEDWYITLIKCLFFGALIL